MLIANWLSYTLPRFTIIRNIYAIFSYIHAYIDTLYCFQTPLYYLTTLLIIIIHIYTYQIYLHYSLIHVATFYNLFAANKTHLSQGGSYEIINFHCLSSRI